MEFVFTDDKLQLLAEQIFDQVNNRIDDRIVSDSNKSDDRRTLSINAIKKYIQEYVDDVMPKPMTKEELEEIIRS